MSRERAKLFALLILSSIFALEGLYLMRPGHDIESYVKWGFPPWLHVLVGASLLSTALLLPFGRSRWLGAGIGGCFIVFETIATSLHRDYGHAVQGPVFLVLLIWLARR